MRKKLQNWQQITSDPNILELVKGIKLDFKEPPIQNKLPNEIKFSKEDEKLVRLELQRFLDLGILQQSTIEPGDFVSNLFIRHKKEPGKIRILANLKKLNEYVKHIHFKMETLESIVQLVKPGSYMVSIDLESSFYSINVHPDYRKYLKVLCLGKIYSFQKLPMGYAQSPLQFCKLMKVPLTYLRSQYGYTNAAFVDDLFLVEDTYDFAKKSSVDTVLTLQFLGYTVNVPKSGLEPKQKKEHLGLILNSIEMSVTITQDKVNKMIDLSQKILAMDQVQIRTLASLIGQMNAARLATLYGPLHTKSLEIAKNIALAKNQGDFDAFLVLSPLDRLDIQWWIQNCPRASRPINTPPIDTTIYTDASLVGYGFYSKDLNKKGGGRWSETEQQYHVNQLEIKAVHLALLCLFPHRANLHIKVFSDSQVAIRCIVKQGSTHSMTCNSETRNLLLFCEKQNFQLSMAHIPGLENTVADKKSRVFKNPDTEWSLDHQTYLQLCHILQFQPCIDLFAERLNTKCPTYCSWELDPHATHIDAFTVDWTEYQNLYAFPPFSMIGRVLHHFRQCQKTRLLLVVPWWKTQIWWTPVLNMAIANPVTIQVTLKTLVLKHQPNKKHSMVGKLSLVGVLLSTELSESRAFQEKYLKPSLWLELNPHYEQYKEYFERWKVYCHQRSIDPSNPNLNDCFQFLTNLKDKLGYSSISTAKVALNSFIKIDGKPL